MSCFLSPESNSHREAWSYIMILLITRLLKMSDDRVSCQVRGLGMGLGRSQVGQEASVILPISGV